MNLTKLVKNIPLSPLEREVLTDMVEHMEEVQKLGIRGVAARNYTSTTTIMRLAKKTRLSRLY